MSRFPLNGERGPRRRRAHPDIKAGLGTAIASVGKGLVRRPRTARSKRPRDARAVRSRLGVRRLCVKPLANANRVGRRSVEHSIAS
jgi:hypothetical protein